MRRGGGPACPHAEAGGARRYRGLSASLLRTATYTGPRLAIYSALSDRQAAAFEAARAERARAWAARGRGGAEPRPRDVDVAQTSTFVNKVAIGSAAGGIGAVVGNPAEVCAPLAPSRACVPARCTCVRLCALALANAYVCVYSCVRLHRCV